MRRIAIVFLVAALPLLAQSPPPAAETTPPAQESAPSAGAPKISMDEGFRKYLMGLSPEEREAVLMRIWLRTAGPPCYFIQQVNKDLQKPKDKPEVVPLASATVVPAGNANPNCLSDSLVRKAVAK